MLPGQGHRRLCTPSPGVTHRIPSPRPGTTPAGRLYMCQVFFALVTRNGGGRGVRQYFRALKAAFRHSETVEAAGLWQFGLASALCIVLAVFCIAAAIVRGDSLPPALLASLAFVAIALANAIYMNHAAYREGLLSDNPRSRHRMRTAHNDHPDDGSPQ